VNPGAAGFYGIHTVRTLIRLVVDMDKIRDLEVIEMTSPYKQANKKSGCLQKQPLNISN